MSRSSWDHRERAPGVFADIPVPTRRAPRWTMIVDGMVLLAICLLDIVTGRDIIVGPLYIAAVAAVTWRHSLLPGFVAAALAVGGWGVAESISGYNFSSSFAFWENAVSWACVYLVTAMGVHIYRVSLEIHRRRLLLLEYFICCCPACGRMSASREGWFTSRELFEAKKRSVRYCPECAKLKAE